MLRVVILAFLSISNWLGSSFFVGFFVSFSRLFDFVFLLLDLLSGLYLSFRLLNNF